MKRSRHAAAEEKLAKAKIGEGTVLRRGWLGSTVRRTFIRHRSIDLSPAKEGRKPLHVVLMSHTRQLKTTRTPVCTPCQMFSFARMIVSVWCVPVVEARVVEHS